MAWMEYFAVRSSTVYENKGLAKALLMTIALMIQRAEEGEEPTENEGWCFASERYLAESLGMSESRVCVWVDKFFDDGWLVVEQKRNAHGHLHNRYRMADNAMSRLEKMKRERGAERPKNLNKFRVGSVKNFLRAPSNEASALGAMKPPRSEQDGVAARSAQRSGGRGFSEKSLQNAEGETAASASQRENLGETPNPQKAQSVQTAGSCAPLQPSADRETIPDCDSYSCRRGLCVGKACQCSCHQVGEPDEQVHAPTARLTPITARPLPDQISFLATGLREVIHTEDELDTDVEDGVEALLTQENGNTAHMVAVLEWALLTNDMGNLPNYIITKDPKKGRRTWSSWEKFAAAVPKLVAGYERAKEISAAQEAATQ